MQYHSKATDTVCSIKLKREEFLYIRTISSFQAECVLSGAPRAGGAARSPIAKRIW